MQFDDTMLRSTLLCFLGTHLIYMYVKCIRKPCDLESFGHSQSIVPSLCLHPQFPEWGSVTSVTRWTADHLSTRAYPTFFIGCLKKFLLIHSSFWEGDGLRREAEDWVKDGSLGSAPSNRIWNNTTLHSQKQQIWLRTALCGGWCRRTGCLQIWQNEIPWVFHVFQIFYTVFSSQL